MNIVILGLLSGNYSGLEGGILLMIAHGLVSGGLFLIVGCLINRYKVRGIKYYRGLIGTMPLLSACFTILNLANIGLPLTGNFIGETLIFLGLFKDSILVGLTASISILLAGIYGI